MVKSNKTFRRQVCILKVPVTRSRWGMLDQTGTWHSPPVIKQTNDSQLLTRNPTDTKTRQAPDKKSHIPLAVVDSTRVGTSILEGGGSEMGRSSNKIDEDQRMQRQKKEGLKFPSHWRRRLNLSVSSAQQEFEFDQKCRDIELQMQMPIRDRRTTWAGTGWCSSWIWWV